MNEENLERFPLSPSSFWQELEMCSGRISNLFGRGGSRVYTIKDIAFEVVGMNALPNIAQKDSSAKMKRSKGGQFLFFDTTEREHFRINDSICGGLCQGFLTKGRTIALFGNTVENRTEEEIIAMRLPRFYFL